ncbi:MAG: ISAzo13-like element transposase-related protein, partial [Trebonia sp.]
SQVSRLWKDQLAVLADETGLEVHVAHFPPGTSKWNRIEHRLFCHITRTWKARPLMTREDAVAGIAATTTYQGLKVTAVLDDASYPDGVKISDTRMRYLEEHVLDRDPFHGEWNYAVRPAAPEQAPPPGPDLAALAALAGITSLPALLAAAEAPWQAARDHRRHLARGAPRTRDSGGTPWKLPFEAIVTAAACHHRLGMPYRLLSELLGAHESTISLAVSRINPILAPHGITPGTPGPRITTLTRLRNHAAAHGITINGITRQAARNGDNQDDTPETAN